jgi:hypothetical protein
MYIVYIYIYTENLTANFDVEVLISAKTSLQNVDLLDIWIFYVFTAAISLYVSHR